VAWRPTPAPSCCAPSSGPAAEVRSPTDGRCDAPASRGSMGERSLRAVRNGTRGRHGELDPRRARRSAAMVAGHDHARGPGCDAAALARPLTRRIRTCSPRAVRPWRAIRSAASWMRRIRPAGGRSRDRATARSIRARSGTWCSSTNWAPTRRTTGSSVPASTSCAGVRRARAGSGAPRRRPNATHCRRSRSAASTATWYAPCSASAPRRRSGAGRRPLGCRRDHRRRRAALLPIGDVRTRLRLRRQRAAAVCVGRRQAVAWVGPDPA
jgi:hypothetical protein